MERQLREVQSKLMRGLLDLVILQFLKSHPMHGYQIISSIRKNFGVYFGPSTIYPLLSLLEEKGYVESNWDLNNQRPRKVYKLTGEGEGLLSCTEDSLNIICHKLASIGTGKLSLNDVFGKHVGVTVKGPNGR
ncbi:MAG: PadR family transcriptional regulator [Candidatus Bathyarchaeota archaeon]|jgi:PadR family transcriptional regulator PadR|nr:MAG: PadR family transcriptional regulator [Candidatus Bathyarchaeota archaeon]